MLAIKQGVKGGISMQPINLMLLLKWSCARNSNVYRQCNYLALCVERIAGRDLVLTVGDMSGKAKLPAPFVVSSSRCIGCIRGGMWDIGLDCSHFYEVQQKSIREWSTEGGLHYNCVTLYANHLSKGNAGIFWPHVFLFVIPGIFKDCDPSVRPSMLSVPITKDIMTRWWLTNSCCCVLFLCIELIRVPGTTVQGYLSIAKRGNSTTMTIHGCIILLCTYIRMIEGAKIRPTSTSRILHWTTTRKLLIILLQVLPNQA